MTSDLHRIIQQGPISDGDCQSYIYQTLCALKAIHSVNVMHSDIKPANLLVNIERCHLRICDFGLSQCSRLELTTYVTTRWYRAPEVMLTSGIYDTAIDMWSTGCVLAEMLISKPIFTGKNCK